MIGGNKFGAFAAGFTTPTTTGDTAIRLSANAAGENFEVCYLFMGGGGETAPASTSHRCYIAFDDSTGAGTGTAQTPEKFRQRGGAALCGVTTKHTVEASTLNAVAPVVGSFNQYGFFQWSVPRGEGLDALNLGSTEEDSVDWIVVSHQAGVVDANMHWWEPV